MVNMPRQHTLGWIRQQKLGKSKGKWRTRTSGSEAQIGQRFRKQRRARHVVNPNLKTRSLSHKLILPDREGVARKPREIKPKAVRIGKKPHERHKMTGIEKAHLTAFAKKQGIDIQEIDSKINFHENKQHLTEMAKAKGATETEIHGSESAIQEAEAQHASYLHQLANELEAAGYKVEAPEGM
jgi:hypothetical protein